MVKVGLNDAHIRQLLSKVVPPLKSDLHKGQMGRIAVIGGDATFTGAPYYSAQAGLKFGGDLSYVFTAEQAVIPIKSYSPELMVTPFYNSNEIMGEKPLYTDEGRSIIYEQMAMSMASRIKPHLSKMHALVIGPGLGREPQVFESVLQVIKQAREIELPLVLDADALYMLTGGDDADNLHSILGYEHCVLSPNIMEFHRLVKAAESNVKQCIDDGGRLDEQRVGLMSDLMIMAAFQSDDISLKLSALSSYLGNTIILKGASDLIASASITYFTTEGVQIPYVFSVNAAGSPRRCGGQGDVLAGIIGVSLHWAQLTAKEYGNIFTPVELDSNNEQVVSKSGDDEEGEGVLVSPQVAATILASFVTKRASETAFVKQGRSMTTPDVIEEIGRALQTVVSNE